MTLTFFSIWAPGAKNLQKWAPFAYIYKKADKIVDKWLVLGKMYGTFLQPGIELKKLTFASIWAPGSKNLKKFVYI